MYLSYYNLQKKPFQISTDPEFLWFGEKHKEALATLKYGILDNKGFLLLTGDVGTGKTTLINALAKSLGDEVVVARVPDPGMESMDLLNFICHSFRIGKEFVRKDLFLVHFSHFLNTAYTRGKKALLIIDEAQRLSQEMLEEVRQLSNIEREESKLLNIFLIGQNEFNDMLQDGRNEPLLQRITLNYHLQPMDLHETGALIKHRLRVAGGDPSIFNPESIREIFACTKGIPRRINVLCDHCLISGFVRDKTVIDGETVLIAAEELRLPTLQQNPYTELSRSEELSEELEFQEFPEVLEPEELLVGNDEDAVIVPTGSGWSWGRRFAAALAFVGIIGAYVYMSNGSGDPAYQIKQAALRLIGEPESRTQIYPEKQKVFKDTISTVVKEREPADIYDNSRMNELATVQPVIFKPAVPEKAIESLNVPHSVEEHASISSQEVAQESHATDDDKVVVVDTKEVSPANDGWTLMEKSTGSNTKDEQSQAASITESIVIKADAITINPGITGEKTAAESVEDIAEQIDNVVIGSDRSAGYIATVDNLKPDTAPIANTERVDIEVGEEQSREILPQTEDVVLAEHDKINEETGEVATHATVEQAPALLLPRVIDTGSVAEVVDEDAEMPVVTSLEKQARSEVEQSELQRLSYEKISIVADTINLDFQDDSASQLHNKEVDASILHEQDAVKVVEGKNKLGSDDIKTARIDRNESTSKDRKRQKKTLDSGKVIEWLLKKKGNK